MGYFAAPRYASFALERFEHIILFTMSYAIGVFNKGEVRYGHIC